MSQSTSTFKAFYVDTVVGNWTCANIVEYYCSKSEQKDRKKVLDRIKKDLQEVEESNSFDKIRRKAREILDDWKHLEVNQLATGSDATLTYNDNRSMKHHRDANDEGVATLTKK
ncbi:1391_t:CDS:2, partial [Funneliformis geosporum]